MTTRRAHIVFALALAATTLIASRAHADSSLGGPFVLPLYGARAWGMAGAVIARIDDESAVDWNPAGISEAVRTAGISGVQLVPGASLNQAQAVFVMPLGNTRNAETDVVRGAIGAMYTNISADVGVGESYSENHLRIAYAYSPQPVVTFAIAGKAALARSGVNNFDAWGTGVDMAVKLRMSPDWSIALVARDAFSRYTFEDGRDDKKERQYVAGIAHHIPGAIDLEVNSVYVHDGWLRTMVGAESPYIFDRLALRSGLAIRTVGESRLQYAFGASVRATRNLVLHYAANLDDETAFGTTHRFSLGVTF